MSTRLGAASVTLLYAALAGLWIVASATLLEVVAIDPMQHARIEIAKGLAFVAVTSVLLYALLRRSRGGALPGADADATGASTFPIGWRLVLVLVLLALSVPLIGLGVFALQAKQNEREAFANLRVIADFKAAQIDRWLGERRGDAMALAASSGFIERVETFRRNADPRDEAHIRNRLQSLVNAFGYDAIDLLDPAGETILSIGEADPMDAALHADNVRHALAADDIWLSALQADDPGGIHLHVAAALRNAGSDSTVAIVDMRITAARFLFPLVHSWPTASASGETFLVRADGDAVLYLSRLRHHKNAALAMGIPLDTANLPAAAALRTRLPGHVQGRNYRGVPVLSAWAPVAGTDWQLLANLDRDEVLAPAWVTALWISAIALIAAAMVAIALLLLLRAQRQTQRLALRAQSDALLRDFYDLPFIGMAMTSPTTRQWVRFNDRLCEMFGYARAELEQMSWPEMTHPEDLFGDLTEFERMLAGYSEGYRVDKRFKRKDGSSILTSMDVKCVRKASGELAYLVTTIEDITERRAAEQRIVDLSRLQQTLSRCNAALVHSKDEQALFNEVCRALVEPGGMVLAWVGITDTATRRVRVVASAGAKPKDLEYLKGIDINVDADDPHGRGSTGTAIREGTPLWCQDLSSDPLTAPWRERAEKFDWQASAALPLHRGGRVVGALSLYMREVNAFDEETRKLLTEIAADIDFGMDNIGREAARKLAEQRHLRQRDALAEFTEVRDPGEDLIGTIRRVTRISARTLDVARVSVWRYSEDRSAIRCEDLYELDADRHSAGVELAAATHPAYFAALEQNDVIAAADARHDPRTREFADDYLAPLGIGAMLDVPINGTGAPAGVLCHEHVGPPRHWSADEESFAIAVANLVSLAIEWSERRRAEERLAHLAQHDQLTDLPNRVLLTDRLKVALGQTQRTGKALALMFLDLDRFKHVNDSMGHDVGDRLLRETAARLRSCVRASDTVSRQGGDEFLVMLPDIDNAQDAARVADKLIAAMSRPFVLDGAEVLLTISVGIACAPADGSDAEALLRNADAAMFAAKDSGRNRYQFYSPDMNARAHDRLALEADLRRAIELEQLFLVFQPQVELGSGALAGFEALVRWRHPTRGVVPPGEFIGIAEDSGLIAEIGAWVLEAACRQQVSWVQAGLPAGTMAVNVSAHQFRQPGFVATVTQALERSGLAPQRLELEVTESVIMQGAGAMQQRLEELDRLGVTLAIDDFGTGYSSLAYLKQFPIDRLKIDQSFVRGLPEDRGSAAITQAVISLGHSLGLNVLAEGVETEAQADFLRSMWCDAGQGYFYARPMPAAECTEYLLRQPASSAASSGINRK